MNRFAARAVLVSAVVAIALPALLVAGGIAAGAWVPAVAVPSPTASPASGGDPEYAALLAEVGDGLVEIVVQEGDRLEVTRHDRTTYEVALVDPGRDVYGDLVAAADAGNVEPPAYINNDGGPAHSPLAWDDFLELVERGDIFDVFHEGRVLQVSAEDASYVVTVPDEVDDVLDAIEAAAAEGGVQAPYYSKVPAAPSPS